MPPSGTRDLAFKRALRAWNRAAARVPGWPQRRLTLPRVRKIWGWPLTNFAGLHSEAYAFLARKRQTHGLFVGGRGVYELAEQTIKTQLENVRMAACALVHEGIRPELLGNLRSVFDSRALQVSHQPSDRSRRREGHILGQANRLRADQASTAFRCPRACGA